MSAGPLWSEADLLQASAGRMTRAFAATGVSIDTRTLASGDLFVALRGDNGDGHAHLHAALAAGAAGVMAHDAAALDHGMPALVVDDTQAALTRLGAFGRARFAGRVVAITGSVGKTTTKEMLRAALAAQGPTHAAIASYNNHWGVPLTLARMPPRLRYAVVEIGMNHAGEIAPLARIAAPDVALITAIERVHVGHLGGIEAIADEKAALVAALEPGGVAVLPQDSPHFARLRARVPDGARFASFGETAGADARLTRADADAEGTTIEATIDGRAVSLRLAASGRHMAVNAVAALACVAALGADVGAAAAALDGFRPLAGRGQRRRIALDGGVALLLDESYNASGASMRAALAVLGLQPAARRVAVLGDMLELGAESEAEHAALAPDVAANADHLFACGAAMRALFDALPPQQRGAHRPDASALAPLVRAALRPGDAVLVKGSLGSRMAAIVAALDAR